MLARLRGCDDVRLGFDGPGLQERGPVGQARADGKGRGVGEDLCAASAEDERGFGETDVVAGEELRGDGDGSERSEGPSAAGVKIIQRERS